MVEFLAPMNDFYTHLKLMSGHDFQQLVFHLLKARYPSADVKSIEGQSGDQGIDAFSGRLNNRPTIWQCKAFSGAIGNSQKNQIRTSLNTALSYSSPSQWVLCLNCDFDAPSMRWFQR